MGESPISSAGADSMARPLKNSSRFCFLFGSLSSAASAATAAPATMTPHSTSTGYIFPGRILPNSIAFSGKPADICMAQARSVFMSRAPILKASVTHSPSSAGMLNRSASRALSV